MMMMTSSSFVIPVAVHLFVFLQTMERLVSMGCCYRRMMMMSLQSLMMMMMIPVLFAPNDDGDDDDDGESRTVRVLRTLSHLVVST